MHVMFRTIADGSSYGPGYIWCLSGCPNSSTNSYPNPNAKLGHNTTIDRIPDTAHISSNNRNYTAIRHARYCNCIILRAGATCCAAKCPAKL